MGEAILVKAGGAGSWNNGGGSCGQYVPMTEIIQENTTFTMPKTQGQEIAVRIFGGGGGNMNNAILNIPAGTRISVIIGDAGISANGGTTSFGTYLSATGGERGNGCDGGNGGTGGGASMSSYGYPAYAGSGTYGGGGGGAAGSSSYLNGGNGGNYGGGGGGILSRFNRGISLGGWGNSANNGFNSIGMGLEFEGAGIRGNSYEKYHRLINNGFCGGGGGYGGNGGNGYAYNDVGDYRYGCGGGGGYGGNGGNGYCNYADNEVLWSGGGGGGYGNDGGDAINSWGGGGGGYGLQGFGHGAGGTYGSAKAGVCILSYSKLVES